MVNNMICVAVATLLFGVVYAGVPVAPLAAVAPIAYRHAVPYNVPPYASAVNIQTRSLVAPLAPALPVPLVAARAAVGPALPFAAAPYAAALPYAPALPYAAAPYAPALPYAAAPYAPALPYAASPLVARGAYGPALFPGTPVAGAPVAPAFF